MTTDLSDKSVDTLRGVGPGTRGCLARLGIRTLRELMFHLPLRYEDRTRVTPLAEINGPGEYLIEGRVILARPTHGKPAGLIVALSDDSAEISLRFFRMQRRQAETFATGCVVRAWGSVNQSGRGLEMVHPDYRIAMDAFPQPPTTLTPVYPLTTGLSQTTLRKLIAQTCALPWPEDDGLPWSTLRELHNLANKQPDRAHELHARLALDELTAYRLVMSALIRKRMAARAPGLPRGPALGRRLLSALGFELTAAQRRTLTEILADLERPVPMLRLLQGDVGSGKTIIAAFAAIRAAESSCQTAVMAPTELLAAQLHANFSKWLGPLGIKTVLLTSAMGARERRDALARISSGDARVVTGTHALIQTHVNFHRLALVVVDEQHRFGVHQRMRLRDKGEAPHQLVMTATPIPRTLTMSLYADMDVSVLNELPKGRLGITTRVMGPSRRAELLAWLKVLISRGEQAYWVCTLIEPNDEIPARAAEEAFEVLGAELPGVRIGLLHGRMKPDQKAAAFRSFSAGETELLVATTVIEVGVDVPNATAIIIEDPDRLGLAQLHQLRGRVGRGNKAGHCILLHDGKLSAVAKERLRALRESQDGFWLAEKDLELRGPGEVLGTRQTGEAMFRIADPFANPELLQLASERAERLLAEAPATARRLMDAWSPGSDVSIAV